MPKTVRKQLARVVIFLLLILAIQPIVSAQNFQSIEKKAIRTFKKGNLVKARDQFQLLYDSGFNLNQTASYLAKCHLRLFEISEAKQVLGKLRKRNSENIYLYAYANILSEDFSIAERLLSQLKDTITYDLDGAKNMLRRAKNNYKDSRGFMVQNLGPKINTADREYSGIMYNNYNKLIFTKRTERSDVVDADGLAYEKIFSTQTDTCNKSEWFEPVILQMDGNQIKSHDATVQVYRSGTKMVSYRDGDLFSHTLVDDVWQLDDDLFLDGVYGNNTHCFITEDEQTLFFASDFQSENAQLDLFTTRKDSSGRWSVPEPITELNTPLDEDSPFLARNGTLYFSSRGHESMGGFDIYQTTYDSMKKQWRKPENLGHPINTVAEDTYFSMEGKVGYLSSTRAGGYGSLDLYRVFLFNRVSVSGQLLDSLNNPISDAEVNIKYDSIQLKTFTDANGAYKLLIPVYKEMKLTFEKDSRQLHQGEYIAHVYFKDKNDNSYNFYFENTEDVPLGTVTGESEVKHINVKVRNDYAENLIVDDVPLREEIEWADSLNMADSVKYVKDLIQRDETRAARFIKETVKAKSDNLEIKDIVVIKQIEDADLPTDENTSILGSGGDKIYTVQILAVTMPREPKADFFNKLEPNTVVLNAQGGDGLNRFYVGEYDTRRSAREAMRELKKLGYEDAFIRKIKQYQEL